MYFLYNSQVVEKCLLSLGPFDKTGVPSIESRTIVLGESIWNLEPFASTKHSFKGAEHHKADEWRCTAM